MRTLLGDPETWSVSLARDVVADEGARRLALPGELGEVTLSPTGWGSLHKLLTGQLVSTVAADNHRAARRPEAGDHSQERSRLVTLVDKLEAGGFLVVTNPVRDRFDLWWKYSMKRGRLPAKVFAPSAVGVLRACISASRCLLPLCVLATLWLLPLAVDTYKSEPARGLFVGLVPAGVWALHVLLLFLHEGGHVLASHAVGEASHRLVVRTRKLEVQSSPFSTLRATRIIATAGPVAAALFGLLVTLMAIALPIPTPFAVATGGFAILHLLALSPFYSDGKMLRRRDLPVRVGSPA